MIVVATEDTALLEILRAEIEGQGCDVAWALDGQEAEELCHLPAAQGLFLDCCVQVISAFELCELLRGDPGIPAGFPIILLSGDDLNSRKLAQLQVTEQFPKTHAAADLRELLSRIGVTA